MPIIKNLTTIKIAKEYLKFSAAHFTVFSATDRERLHGHNFQVTAEIQAVIDDNGLCFDYAVFKQLLDQCCRELDEYVLLAAHSPHLTITEEGNNYRVEFNGETLQFLQADTLLLPIKNTSVEELSGYVLERLIGLEPQFAQYDIRRIQLAVSSGPGQSGSSEWFSDK